MYAAQRGLYNYKSTISQFAETFQQFIYEEDPYPFTNANLTGLSPNLSGQQSEGGDDYIHQDLSSKEESSVNDMSANKKPLSKAERRAEHNAIEPARRGSLNSKFQCLAQAFPNLISYRRPSKSQIVAKALDWVRQSLSREEKYRHQILQLQRENRRLLLQLVPQQQQKEIVSLNASLTTSTIPDAPLTLRHSASTPNISTTVNNDPPLLLFPLKCIILSLQQQQAPNMTMAGPAIKITYLLIANSISNK